MPSIPTIGSFDPPTTTADEAALQEHARTLVAHSGRIIGQGTAVMEQMNTTAVDFSELVAEPLKRNGQESLAASEIAMQGAVWGSTVTERWATDVTTFKETIAALEAEWAAAVAADFGAGPDPAAIAAAGQAKLAEMNARANEAYELLKANAATAGGMLTGGPTPANLQALAAGAGGASWLAFNVFGTAAGPPPVTGAEGAALADMILGHFANGTPLPPALFDVMRSLAQHAQNLQSGALGALSADQLAYLEQFFRGLDRPWNANLPIDTNMLYHLPEIIGNSGLSAGDQSLMLGAVGGGLLALSDHRLGGGSNRLPGTVQGLIGRYFGGGGTPAQDSANQLNALGAMLGATGHQGVGLERLQGGEELSAALTMSVADANSIPELVRAGAPVDEFLLGLNGFEEGARTELLGVATRHTEVNGQLLTGRTVHPDYGSDTPEFLVRSLFGHDWHDDGMAAAGLVNWISDPNLPEQYRDLATESAYTLFTVSTNEDVNGRWGAATTYGVLTDGFGAIGPFEAAPVGVANPHIAQAMARTAVSYLDYFDDSNTGGPNRLALSVDPRASDMYLNLQTRENFFELAMGDKGAADLLGTAAYARMIASAGEAHLWEGLPEAETHGANGGMLARLLDTGLTRMMEDATTDAEGVTAHNTQQAAWFRAGAAAVKELISELPVVRQLGDAGRIFMKELLEAPKWAPGAMQAEGWVWGSGRTPAIEDPGFGLDLESVKLGAAHSLVDALLKDPESGIDIRDVEAVDSRLVTTDDAGNTVLLPAEQLLGADIPPSQGDPEQQGNMQNREARQFLEEVLAESCYDDAGANLDEFVREFFARRESK
ncbi:hypothetical protein K3N28_00765 [Glycomyces sp. TRM65418]|uniref:TPR repeat region-containing protein n=1 Tax=Glycomyces sp. TRM65418 TaxID=2867006 RepID=UPI001CE51A71|nr:hypothetical protein [Glycomyces sp. TRM65418]MCC3761606.1 hypothetical protein [Glycomyces sp. TRM65418]QZD55702.1 hypothetical protein K3N28_00755 [Glycomyces sp. TRM65418]